MSVTQAQYMSAKEIMEEIQHLPPEAQQTILSMLHGAVAVSDLYRLNAQNSPSERESA